MAITRGGASSSKSVPSCSRSEQFAELRSSKRQKQSDPKHSETAAAVDDVMEDQGVEPSLENDVSDHEETQMDMEEDSVPLQPERFFFSPDKYVKNCKISTRCSIVKTLAALEKLSETEKQWFRDHKQFKHIWHLIRQDKNKVQGMWLLLLRNTSIEKKKVCWFVVNGVPIRYSMREHALITGFDCHEYAADFNAESFGSWEFVERVFGTRKVQVNDVENMLQSMDGVCGGDRLQVAVQLFLSKVIRGRRKFNTIHPFILKIVNNLRDVETFPWGRNTFEDNLDTIEHMMNHLDGEVHDDYLFPGFIISLEVLAFECIPELSKRFQIAVRGAKDQCPLMCKRKFKETGMSGFPLEELNNALGTTKDIISILKPSAGEEAFLLSIMERAEVEDSIDPIADAWNNRLDVEQKSIWWENLYKLDVAARGFGEVNVPAASYREEPQQDVPAASHKEEEELLLPFVIKRMVKTAVAEAMKDVYKRLEKLEREAEARKDGEWDEAGVRGCFEKNGVDTFDDETGFEKNGEPAFEKNVESGFEENVEPAVGGDDTVDDGSIGGQKTGGDEAAELQMVGEKETGGDEAAELQMVGEKKTGGDIVKKQKFKQCAKKKCNLAPKRKLKPSIHVKAPYTEEKAKKEKKKE
ncbi:uncharacterized protein At3g43530, partial [Arabidopsis lyrata subsp. lyrata]|uniref:uncharacterized protein At3g43530 n=1 Tax=Arabidopsis lyrata subsp. lyrata TaxID=81972 RepID=UPI000A29E47C